MCVVGGRNESGVLCWRSSRSHWLPVDVLNPHISCKGQVHRCALSLVEMYWKTAVAARSNEVASLRKCCRI